MSDHSERPENNIKVAFFLNLGFALLEVAGGLWTNSIAILSDALHDFGDTIALGLSWYLANVSRKERDNKFSYGYKRFSLLGALISSMILLIGSVFILLEAIPRLFNPSEVLVEGMILFAIIGVLVNGTAALKLRHGKTQNEQVVMWHLLEDVLGWIAILIVSIVMLFIKLPILDPLLSIVITAYILWNVFKNLRETVHVFLQAIPSDIDAQRVQTALLQNNTLIHSIHDVHLWSMDGEYNVLSLHLVVANDLSTTAMIDLKNQIRSILKEYNIQHVTIEIEYETESCELANC